MTTEHRIDLTLTTIMMHPVQALFIGLLIAGFSYFIGRLTRTLDYRFQEKQERRQRERRLAKLKEQGRHRTGTEPVISAEKSFI